MTDLTGQYFILDGKEFSVGDYSRFESLTIEHHAVYEVMRVEESIPLFYDDYFERLESSFRILESNLYLGRQELSENIRRLIRINNHQSGPLKLVMGSGDRKFILLHLMKPYLPRPEEYMTGVKTVLMNAVRYHPNVKRWNPEFRAKTVKLLEKSGAYEAILVDEHGYITEASRSNVFFVSKDRLVTSPSQNVLPGITRKKVLELCQKSGVEVEMKQVRADDIAHYDACMLTGTARKIVPVRCVDSVFFNINNPLVQTISHEYDLLVDRYIREAKSEIG